MLYQFNKELKRTSRPETHQGLENTAFLAFRPLEKTQSNQDEFERICEVAQVRN